MRSERAADAAEGLQAGDVGHGVSTFPVTSVETALVFYVPGDEHTDAGDALPNNLDRR